MPRGRKVLPSVWAMRRKRDIATRTVTKWKARLNIHGGRQTKGIDYWETYTPVASWPSIRLIMYMAVLNNWHTKQLDFVLAFLQAPVETDLYMEIPQGFSVLSSDKVPYCIHILNNLYGQKQAGRVWNQHLTKGLIKIGFTQSETDPCIFWRASVVLVIYTDDTIVTGKVDSEVDKAIADIGSIFDITSQSKVDDFLGVKVIRNESDGTVTLTQPHLIDSIIKDLHLDEKSNGRWLPALVTQVLHRFDGSDAHDDSFHFRSIIGKLNYLEKVD